ncbi:MAG: hypothetical protein JL56_16695 [Desulfotomaculum sp. BICA1-6]|nr:MAG: hypothetical protein JL56_16695 [Desulfotomaculum sp. BICA1-6]KUO61597.1 MAG: hypothetical protein APF84_13780 [Gracilibacter sp. BRH_c7a]
MCYFLGICSSHYIDGDTTISIGEREIVLANITSSQKQKRPGMFYYNIMEGGCACAFFRKRNAVIHGLVEDSGKIEDFSREVRKILNLFPGNAQTEIILYWAGDVDEYSLLIDFEDIIQVFTHKQISKQDFIQKYPFIEERVAYTLI